MGIFNLKKKNDQLEKKQGLNIGKAQVSPKVPDKFNEAVLHVDDQDFETRHAARELIIEMANNPKNKDYKAAMWMATDFEKHNCFSAAAHWYKKAYQLGCREAEKGFERCYNPYHFDPYYNIDGTRGCGTPHLKAEMEANQKAKSNFESAVKNIENPSSADDIKKNIMTIYQIATAYGCDVPEAKLWLATYYEVVEKNITEAKKWYKIATESGDAVAAKRYDEIVKGVVATEEKNIENSPEELIKHRFSDVVSNYNLDENGVIEFFADIYDPDDFCKKAYDYCNKQYADKGQNKLLFEYCMTSFYGCICSVAIWKEDNSLFVDQSPWDVIYKQINVEFTDSNAERLLGTKQKEEKAEHIFEIFSQYYSFAKQKMIDADNNVVFASMKYAYKLGMLVARKYLNIMCNNIIKESISTESGNDTRQNDGGKTDAEFYSSCVMKFHDFALKSDVANRGVIFIPELIPIGEKVLLEFLNDDFFQMQFGSDPKVYYYLIFSLCIESGIAIASKWHADFEHLDEYVDRLIEEGPPDEANKIMRRYLPKSVSADQGNGFFQEIYKGWLELNEPYWTLQDSRDYVFKSLLAGYQLGISIILEKLGY